MRVIKWVVGLLLVFLVACARDVPEVAVDVAPEPPAEAEPQEVVSSVVESPVAPVEHEKIVEAPVPAVPPAPSSPAVLVEKSELMSPEMRDLLGRADRKVKSYSYLFSVSKENSFPHQYFIKGPYVKIKLFELEPYFIENYYDTVYLDTKSRKAFGYCENRRKCISGKYDNTKRVFNVSYDDYRIKTPYEFLKAVSFAEIVGPELIENRNTIKIRQVEGDLVSEMWLDDAYGLPRRVVISRDGVSVSSYNFADMQFNALSDSDVWRGPN